MQILVVTHYFPPEIGAPQARLSELARFWSAEGELVTVLTGMPNHPTGIVPTGYSGAWLRKETLDGYRVIRTWLYATPNEGLVKKTLGHVSFMLTSVAFGSWGVGRPDVVVVSSPTFFSILSAWALAKAKRARLVVEIRDLWPAIFVELGVLTNRWVIKALETVELGSYGAADAVVVVSDGFRENLVGRGVPASKIHTIRNGVDLERFAPGSADPRRRDETRRRLGAPDGAVLVLYVGAHGISHGLRSIADAVARLRGTGVHMAFVGEGAAKHELEDHIKTLGTDNITTLPGVPRDEVPRLLDAADICLVPLRDVPLFSTFIPSKLFEYLGAGKAVIGSVRGEPAAILREAGALVVEPEDVDGIARAIEELACDPDRRSAMGEQGRRYVEANFDRRRLADGYLDVLRSVTDEEVGTRSKYRGALSTTGALVRFVWNHPENSEPGMAGRARAIGRLAGWQAWQRVTRRPLTVAMPGGLRLVCHPHSTAASGVVYCGLPEWEDMRFVLDFMKPGDRFVDVGANVGVYSLLAASDPEVDVCAYEPSSSAFSRLQENVRRNDLEGRVITRRSAVGSCAGEVLLTTGLDTVNRVVGPEPPEAVRSSPPRTVEEVRMVTLDEDLPGLDRTALVKIDVEGLEPQVLEGATALIESQKPALVIEANDRGALRRCLEPAGYRPFSYDPRSRGLKETSWFGGSGNNLLALADLDDALRRLRAGKAT